MDSRTVCLCSAAFRRICSRMMSAFSLSTRARALDSASIRRSSFLCLSSISCSIVAVKTHHTTGTWTTAHFCEELPQDRVINGRVLTFPHGLLFLHRLLLFAEVLLIQGLLFLKKQQQGNLSTASHYNALYNTDVGNELTCCRSWSSYRCLASLSWYWALCDGTEIN